MNYKKPKPVTSVTSICNECKKTISEIGFMESTGKEIYMSWGIGKCTNVLIHNQK